MNTGAPSTPAVVMLARLMTGFGGCTQSAMPQGFSEWSDEEDELLTRLQAEGFSNGEISRISGRERDAVRRRLQHLTPTFWADRLPRCPKCDDPLTQEGQLRFCRGCGYETPESLKVPAHNPGDESYV